MKKILLSLVVLTIMGTTLWAGTRAYFTDTETSVGNTFTTGTIDISVDGTNPWTRTTPYQLTDMKPSQTDYINFTVYNSGTNPVNLYKTLNNFVTANVATNESEQEADPTGEVNDVENWINYDLKVELYDVDPAQNPTATPVWWENIYTDGMGHDKLLGTLEDQAMYLGMIPVGKWMKVYQSYHMIPTTGNAYQGDQLTFDITLTAEQLGAHSIRLENKEQVNGQSYTMWWDSTFADLAYKVKDSKFGYSLNVQGAANGTYNLVAWEGYPGFVWGAGPTATVLANVTVSGGTVTLTDQSVELNKNLTNAKVWLAPGAFVTPGTTMTLGYNPATTLFDTGLMDYYDADL